MTRNARLRVRVKGSSKLVSLVPPSSDDTRDLLRHARGIAESAGNDIDGYLVIAWDQFGAFWVNYKTDILGPRMAAALVKEIVSSEVSGVAGFTGNFSYIEGL